MYSYIHIHKHTYKNSTRNVHRYMHTCIPPADRHTHIKYPYTNPLLTMFNFQMLLCEHVWHTHTYVRTSIAACTHVHMMYTHLHAHTTPHHVHLHTFAYTRIRIYMHTYITRVHTHPYIRTYYHVVFMIFSFSSINYILKCISLSVILPNISSIRYI